MEIFIDIVTIAWCGLAVACFTLLILSIIDKYSDKQDVGRYLGLFVVAAITAIALLSII